MLRAVQIRRYVAVMQQRGFAPESVLEGSGLDVSRLADPGFLVDLPECRAVVSNLIRLTGNQGIGLDMGQETQLAEFGIIAHAMMSARTLRQAVHYWLRYSNLAGMLIRITQLDEDESWTVVFSEIEPLGFVYNFCVEEIIVTGIRFAAILSGQEVDIARICLSYPAPLHAQVYADTFGCPIQFNAPRSSVTIRKPHFDVALSTRDEELNEALIRQCSRVMRQIAGNRPVSTRLRALLLQHAAPPPKLEEAAHLLGISARSLRRHLVHESTSYQRVGDEFRLDLAREYLKTDELVPKEIGFLLGFRDTNAFRRAFKTWSGLTIQEYRRQLQREKAERRSA